MYPIQDIRFRLIIGLTWVADAKYDFLHSCGLEPTTQHYGAYHNSTDIIIKICFFDQVWPSYIVIVMKY